ncbi:Hypothetical predicted protein [Mytilus galloprovincialis]|uniref:Uncharacterized protein n=1 Tax=Mytilus galloprovincialis TaxID=29158 RepID=A0A8B6DUN9_MYTGA|nr:Hypothetical predicted protein [Mytilus galloprovincialis]
MPNILSTAEHQVPVSLRNVTDKYITLKKNCNIGTAMEVAEVIEEAEDCPTLTVRKLEQLDSGKDILSCIPEHLQDMFMKSKKNLSFDQSRELAKLLVQFQDIFAKNELDIGHFTKIKHRIDTGDAAPVKERLRRTPLGFEKEEKAHLQDLLNKKIIQPSSSEWAAAPVLIRKKCGALRCISRMASIERELEYDVREDIELEGNRTVVIMGKKMEVLNEMVEADPKAPQCLLCPLTARHQAKHALDKHLPWELAVVNNVEYPEGLMNHVNEIMAERKTNRNFTEQELSLVRLFNRFNDYPALQGKKLKSKSVYSLHTLIHWKVLVIVISKLQSNQQHWIKTFEEYKSEAGISLGPLAIKLSGPISIADSHFHLDTLLVRTGCSGFHELSDFGTRDYYKTCMMFMVAYFCFPSSLQNSSQRTELRKTPSVHFSFGIHPRTVNSSSPSNLHRHLTDLEYLVKSSRTVAI